MYTNTSNAKAIAGLLFVTFASSVIVLYTPQIVEGMKSLAIKGKDKAEELMHHGKKQYSVCHRLYNGKIIDTGERVWR